MSGPILTVLAALSMSPLSLPARAGHEHVSSAGPMGCFVGELQEKWQFTSDHLPIGMTINGMHIASWNILNAEYMSWVTEKNSQGLSRSLIALEHIYIDETQLTFRDLHVIDQILSMLDHPTHPRSLISLQECSTPFIAQLRNQLPERYGVVLSSDLPIKDQTIVIYDKNVLEYDPSASAIANNLFSIQMGHEVMNLCFHGKDQDLRIINAHLPGLPGNPAPNEFAAFVASQTSKSEVAIAMGDMNANEVVMDAAFRENLPEAFHYILLAPYCTNISPSNLHSKSIDHFMILATSEHAVEQNGAEEVLKGLQETVDLLPTSY